MIGTIIGDIAGSRYEWNNIKTKNFELLNSMECFFTDDTVMTLAVAKSLLDCNGNYNNLSSVATKNMVEIGRKYPNCGFGGNFYKWIMTDNHEPYNSYGNGAAMRVSPCGYIATSLDEAIKLSTIVTNVSHNHIESVKASNIIAGCIYLLRCGKSKEEVKKYVEENYCKLDFTIDEIRDTYQFDVSCQGSVPQALEAFFEANDFEDAIRNAISIGGDSDTIAAITGGIAASYYEVPDSFKEKALSYLSPDLIKIYNDFSNRLGIQRFIETHEKNYDIALLEIKNGQKRSHWMWYIFPQLKGLGKTSTSNYYGLCGVDEVKAYMSNEYLRNNMIEICEELIKLDDSVDNIFGYPDNLKLNSCMTLFEYCYPDIKVFGEIIDKFYDGKRDNLTLKLIKNKN